MKYLISSIILIITINIQGMAQQFGLQIQSKTSTNTHYVFDIAIAFTSAGNLGSGNIQLSFDTSKLELPILSNQTLNGNYEVYLTQPSPGIASLNFILNQQNTGSSINTNWLSLVEIQFHKKANSIENTDFKWLYNGGSTETVIFLDDNTTQITASPINLIYDINDGVLPVELDSFRAKVIQREVVLNWTTLSELNNSHFNIQRSSDGRNFENIGRINGRGTTTSDTNYQFIDTEPMKHLNYYKLEMVDFDAKKEYSRVRTIEIDDIYYSISVSPNPAKEFLNINYNNSSEEHSVKIINSQGIVLKEFQERKKQISIAHLPTGVYFLVIDDIHYIKWVKH